jgi:type II secretory pathway pseudopilin PulG
MVPLIPLRHQGQLSRAAFTLVELAVLASILVVASAVSFPSLVRSYEEQKLHHAAIELQSHLQRGRALAERLQGSCSFSLSNNNGVQVAITPAASFSGTNICTATSLASLNLGALNLGTLNLSQLTGVRGLSLSSIITPANGSAITSTCPAATPCSTVFHSLGLLAGHPQTFYLSGTGTTSQSCVELSLSLIRVGFRNSASGACTYSRS